jgi:two-component system CheB/CheR fusion protein
MYFNSEVQGIVVSRFHFALNGGGYLFLGRSEMLLTHADLFRPVDLRYHIFSKVPKTTPRDRLLSIIPTPDHEMHARRDKQLQLVMSAIDALPLAQVVVDMEGKLIMANEKARSLFSLATADLGRSFKDLELSYLPVELRSLIDKAYSEHQSVAVPKVERHLPNASVQYLDVQVTPLQDNGQVLGVEITFDDMTASYKLQEEVEHSKQDLETAYEELQSTNEELETTNEELQSTVEELETTNEELQSTNEEMETMNEELQSTNEELQTMNDELQKRTDELNGANSFLQSVLTGIHSSVMVLDKSFNILSWNEKSEEMWGLRADEVKNKPFFGLEIGLPLEPLRTGILSSLKGEGDQPLKVVDAINRRGKAIEVSISTTPLIGSDGNRQGVILLVEEMGRQTNGSAAK